MLSCRTNTLLTVSLAVYGFVHSIVDFTLWQSACNTFHKIFSKSTKILRVYLTNWGSHSGYSITSTIRIHQILMFYLLRYHNTWLVSLFYHSLYLQFHIWQHSFRLRQYFQSGSFTSSSTSIWASLVAQLVKNPPAIREIWVWCLG